MLYFSRLTVCVFEGNMKRKIYDFSLYQNECGVVLFFKFFFFLYKICFLMPLMCRIRTSQEYKPHIPYRRKEKKWNFLPILSVILTFRENVLQIQILKHSIKQIFHNGCAQRDIYAPGIYVYSTKVEKKSCTHF